MSKEISLEKVKQLLLKWKNDKNIQKLKTFYNTKSFSKILGVERREMSHSNFIAWILDDKESHNLSQFAIRQLFDILLEYGEDGIQYSLNLYNENNDKKIEYNNLYKSLMLENYKIEDLDINVEKVIKNQKRIDIIISMKIKSTKDDIELPQNVNIIIENKVDSKEHDNQTKTYYNYYTTEKKYKNDLNLFVYLLPISTSRLYEKLSDDEHYININYQLLSDNIFERALTHDISDRVKFMITEYLLSLRKPSKESKGQTMATGNLEKELLKEFWNEHQELLGTAFKILAEDTDDLEIKKNFEDMEKSTNELNKKDITKYNFNGKTNLSKGKLVLELFKKYVDTNATITYDELNKYSKIFRNGRVIERLNIVQKFEKREKQRYSTKDNEVIELIDGTKVVIHAGWSAGGDDFNCVLKEAELLDKKFEEIRV